MSGGRRRTVVLALALVALVAWCGWVSGFHRATTPARVTWGFSLAAVVGVDLALWWGRLGRRGGPVLAPAARSWPAPSWSGLRTLVGVSPWVGLAVVVAAWDVLGLDTSKHEVHLTISALTQAFRPLNAAMLIAWMVVGFGYGVTRARAPSPRRGADFSTQGGSEVGGLLCVPVLAHAARLSVTGPAPALLLPDSRPAGIAFWLAVPVAVVVVDQLARRTRGTVADAEQFLCLVTGPWVPKVVLVTAWAYAGYHLFAH